MVSKYAYKLVTSAYPDDLEQRVNFFCKQGYKPEGGIVSLPQGGFAQSMVLEYAIPMNEESGR